MKPLSEAERKFRFYKRVVFYPMLIGWVAFIGITTDDLKSRIENLSQAISDPESGFEAASRHISSLLAPVHKDTKRILELCSENMALQEEVLEILRRDESDFRSEIYQAAAEISRLGSRSPGSPEELYEQASQGRTILSLDRAPHRLELQRLQEKFDQAAELLEAIRNDITLRESRLYFYHILTNLAIKGAFRDDYPAWKESLAHERNRLKVALAQLEAEAPIAAASGQD